MLIKSDKFWRVVYVAIILALLIILWSLLTVQRNLGPVVNRQVALVSVSVTSLRQDFVKLIKTHPRSEIREKLRDLIVDQKVALCWQEDIFVWLRGYHETATVYTFQSETGALNPVLHLSKSFFSLPLNNQYLVLWHQYFHITQILRSAAVAKDFYADSNLWLNGPVNDDRNKRLFEQEILAYEIESQLAKQLGLVDYSPVYKIYEQGGLDALRQELLDCYAQTD